jgi:hypothetical protein
MNNSCLPNISLSIPLYLLEIEIGEQIGALYHLLTWSGRGRGEIVRFVEVQF